jgi:ribonuclease P protein component
MIGRAHRFHGYNSLRPVYQRGKTVRGSVLSLKYSSRGQKPYRVAVVVSRKVHKSAVVRNRIRRRIYEICRQSTLDITGLDLVFTVFSDQIAGLESTKLQSMVSGLLEKATGK